MGSGLPNLAVIACGGPLPRLAAEGALASGRQVTVVGLAGVAGENIVGLPHQMIKWGELGRLFDILKKNSVEELVFVGSITRPEFSDIKVDWGGLVSLPKIYQIMRGGDDAVLRKIVRFFEESGYRVVGAHEVAPELIAQAVSYSSLTPDEEDREDIALGFQAARSLGSLDVGQASIADGGRVIAVEGLEGTDGLIARAGDMRKSRRWRTSGKAGVLVKAAKPEQDLRVDMPVIGPSTVEHAAEAGLKGIAVEAGRVMVLDRMAVKASADKAGLFVIGL